ncbi:HIG1 domain family member 2A, mitochondrial [Sitophilus oryzae]|uniref:HIG1 domain family member 2A, mitochondrial n=1 Tax=Sitophilus oryzae TaxID=7048 RepID=A0A6J2XRG8_SITOR|nr:HIG1 domain family member 2A, mitochondrial [Sitophilus oryzae]
MLEKITSTSLTEEEMSKFDWLNLHKELEAARHTEETNLQKLIRKCSENPLVPIGTTATSAALIYGIWTFRTGQRKMSQYMMRTRVAAQAITIFAVVFGYIVSVKNN